MKKFDKTTLERTVTCVFHWSLDSWPVVNESFIYQIENTVFSARLSGMTNQKKPIKENDIRDQNFTYNSTNKTSMENMRQQQRSVDPPVFIPS